MIRPKNLGGRYATRGGDCADHALRQPAAEIGLEFPGSATRATIHRAAMRCGFPWDGAASTKETLERQQSTERECPGSSVGPGVSKPQILPIMAPQALNTAESARAAPAPAAGMTSALRRNPTISKARRAGRTTRSHPNAVYGVSGRLMLLKRRSLACDPGASNPCPLATDRRQKSRENHARSVVTERSGDCGIFVTVGEATCHQGA